MATNDRDLMRRNVQRINKNDPLALRVSTEHYLWLAKEIERLERRTQELIVSLPGTLDA